MDPTIIFSQHERVELSKWINNVNGMFVAQHSARHADVNHEDLIQPSNHALIDDNMEKNAIEVEDVLEGMTVQTCVKLTSILGHYSQIARLQAAHYLFEVACILDEDLRSRTREMDPVVLSFTMNHGYT